MTNTEPAGDASVSSSVGLSCPNCGKHSDLATGPNSSCARCGFQFSAKPGEERRRDERIKKEVSTVLEYRGQCLESRSRDVSKGGLCVKTSTEFPAISGDTLGLFVGNQRFFAKVMWVNKILDISTVGLQWKSRFVNRIKEIWFSAASVGALFYLIFMTSLIGFMFYLAFFR